MLDTVGQAAAQFGIGSTPSLLQDASQLLRPATIESSTAAPAAPAAAAAPDLEQLVERTCARLFETLSIEQERRGVTPWL
jgi:hypothetical protein